MIGSGSRKRALNSATARQIKASKQNRVVVATRCIRALRDNAEARLNRPSTPCSLAFANGVIRFANGARRDDRRPEREFAPAPHWPLGDRRADRAGLAGPLPSRHISL